MRRNQPARSKRPPERDPQSASPVLKRGASPPQATKNGPPPSETPGAPTAADLRPPFGLMLLLCLAAFVMICCGLIIVLLSVRGRTESWPSVHDVGIVPMLGAVGVGLLVVASVTAWLARKRAQSDSRKLAQVCLFGALVCAGLFIGLRSYEYHALHSAGLWRRSTVGPIHEHADIYYLQAVRLRLKELFQQLDERQVNQPNEFTDEDALRLEVVTNLQANMVDWTEQQVGHWLDDLQQRRAVMELVAYQVYPLARNQAAVASSVQEQLRELERQRQWFNVLYDYCRDKSKLLGHGRPSIEPKATTTTPPSPQVGNATDPAVLVNLDRELEDKLNALGLIDWSYAQSVMTDGADVALTGERLNQITARLDAMEDRTAFLSELKVLELPETEGLNRKYPWLRLPVCLPGGNAWAGSFFALTGLHLLLLVVVVLLSLWVPLSRFDGAKITRWRNVEWWWYASSVTGAVLFLLLYL